MPTNEVGSTPRGELVPSMLDLIRLSPKRLFPPGGVELYRQIALLTEMSPALEVLDVASGKGVPLEYFVREFGVTASGVDVDPEMVEEAERWSRELGAGQRLQFQWARSDALPYRDAIFDVAIGEIGLANHCSPADALAELVRVTKPGGFIVLVQLVWKAPVEVDRRAVLSGHLGVRPMMVVEWKRLLREAGVSDVHVEDWSDEGTAFRPTVAKPFPDFAEMFSVGERMAILRRAWQRWGWRGVSAAVARENEVHKLLTSERILGLDLLRGRRGVARGEPVTTGVASRPEADSSSAADGEAATSSAGAHPDADASSAASHPDADTSGTGASPDGPAPSVDTRPDTAGLPLFGEDDSDSRSSKGDRTSSTDDEGGAG